MTIKMGKRYSPSQSQQVLHRRQTDVVLDLGCGQNKVSGSIGVDRAPLPNVDVVCDLESFPYPFGESTVDEVHLYHVVEHVWEPLKLFEEVGRICREGALVYI